MLISMIILGVLGLMVIVGLGRPILKDFRVNWIAALAFFALVIGLNFIPLITIGNFTFSVGTALFYLTAFVMFFVYGKFSTQMTAMALGLILGGLIYAATRLSLLGGNAFFATTNYVYALVLGTITFLVTRNGKYSFLSAAIAMLLANLLVQIGSPIGLNYGFDWTLVACGTAFTMYALARLAIDVMEKRTGRKSKLAHMFEADRLED